MSSESRLVLAVDVETTGLYPAKDRVAEFGWCLWDADSRRVVQSGGAFVEGVAIPDEIARLTGIDPAWPSRFGVNFAAASELPLAQADFMAFVAHNAPFDRGFLQAEAERAGPAGFWSCKPWVDTLTDLPFEAEPDSRKLRYLALDRGLIPSLPHRAQFDAILTAQLLGTFNFDEVLVRAGSPNRIVRAIVSFDDRQKAKDLSFRWERLEGVERVFAKTWVKRIKECDLAKLRGSVAAAGFRMEIEA